MKMKSNTSKSVRNVVLTALMAAPVALVPTTLRALPATDSTNLTVTNGTATFNQSANTLNITATDKTILNWTEFGGAATNKIAAGETVQYTLGSSSASVLNRIVGTSATTIGGTIAADGKVYILNPNGIVVSSTGSVNTAGFYASTVQEPDGYFAAHGSLSYVGASTKDVSVAGTIKAGEIYLVGKGVTLAATASLQGNTTIKSVDGADVTLAGTATKSLSVETVGAGADVNIGGLTVTNDLVITATGNVDLAATKDDSIVSGNLTITAGGNITQTEAATNSFDNAGSTSVAKLSAGDIAITGNLKTIGVTASTGNASITDDTDDFALATSSIKGALAVKAVTNITANGTDTITVGGVLGATVGAAGSATINASGDLAVGDVVGGATGTLTFTSTGDLSFTKAIANATKLVTTASGDLSFADSVKAATATLKAGGDISLSDTVDATTLTVTSTGGDIVGSDVITATTATFDAAGQIDLDTATNLIGTVILKNGADGIGLLNGKDLVIGSGTSATGNVSIITKNLAGTGTVAFGTASKDVITFGGALSINTTASKDPSAITTAASSLSVAGKTSVNVKDASVTLGDVSSTTNNASFGSINVVSGTGAVTLTEKSTLNLGDITTTGLLTATSVAGDIIDSGVVSSVGATLQAAGNITIDSKTTAIGGTITLNGAKDVLITNSTATTVVGGASSGTAKVTGTARLVVSSGNALTVTGDFNTLEFSAGGAAAVSITDADDLIVQNSAYTGSSTVGIKATTKDLTIGSGNAINSTGAGAAGLTTFESTAGNVLQTGAVSVYGNVLFKAGSAVTLNSSGNSFGQVSITAAANSSLTESGYLRLGAVNVGGKSLTLKSETSDIAETDGTTAITSGALTLNAAKGNVALSTGTYTVGGTIVATTGKDAAITTVGAAVLGNVSTSGALSVKAGGAITQDTSATINSYGDASFVTTGNNTITLANSGNAFGKVTLDSGTGASSVKESSTLNLFSVKAGNFTAVSENGSIIDSPDGTSVAVGAATFKATAAGASVIIDGKTNTFTSAAIETTGDATIVDSAGDLDLAGINVGGAFSASTAGNLTDSASSVIFGATTFETTGVGTSIVLNSSNNQFGALKVLASKSAAVQAVYIVENATTNLAAGSNVNGGAEFVSYGDIITSGTGGSSYTGSLRLNASGGITISNPISVTNGLTVNAPGVKDLSALSKSGNLNNIDPIFLPSKSDTDKGPAL